MKQTHTLKLIIISALLFSSFIHSETNNPAHTSLSASQAEIAEIAEVAEALIAGAFNALQKIENKLTEIALLIKKGLLKKGSDPALVMKVLTENKMAINALLQGQATIMSLKDPVKHLEIAFFISEFCRAFTHYLDTQILNNFKNAKPFNLNRFFKKLQTGKTRNNVNHLEPATLAKGLSKTEGKLKILDKTVQEIGLTWYNKAARKLDSWVVTPANKWHVPIIGMYGAGWALLSTYLLWSFGYNILNKEYVNEILNKKGTAKEIPWDEIKIPETLQDSGTPIWLHNFIIYLYNKFDGPIVTNPHTAQYEAFKLKKIDEYSGNETSDINPKRTLPTDSSLIATVDFGLKELLLNHQPIGLIAGTYFLNSAYKTWSETGGIRDRLTQKRDAMWNFLRGGEYLNTFQPGMVAMKPTVSFKDMVGLDEVKEAFRQILQYIDNPEQLMRIEATPEKGWLLTGPTRTGKSFSVECLCGEIELLMEKRGLANKMKFFNINATLVNEYGIKAILEEVSQNAPAVIFLDEIDLLGLQRVGNNKLLSDFLTAMQSSMNSDPSKIVIIIAATNNPENIDKALRQNGRFGKEIRFEAPSKKYRTQFIIRELTNMAINLKEFDIETLANKTHGKTFEDLKRVIRNAMTRSWMRGSSLTQELLEESIDTELRGILKHNRKDLPENELRIVASHFAGMALAALHLETHEQLDKITIHAQMTEIKEEGVWENYAKKDEKDQQKKIEHGAYLSNQSHDTVNAKTATIILNEATLLLAGFAAEELLTGPCGFTCHKDHQEKARKLIEDLIFGGLNQEALPKNVREELKNKAFDMFKECQKRAMDLLQEHHDALIAVIEQLLKKQILGAKEIKTIIDTAEGRVTTLTSDDIDDIFDDGDDISDEKVDEDDISDPATHKIPQESEELVEAMNDNIEKNLAESDNAITEQEIMVPEENNIK